MSRSSLTKSSWSEAMVPLLEIGKGSNAMDALSYQFVPRAQSCGLRRRPLLTSGACARRVDRSEKGSRNDPLEGQEGALGIESAGVAGERPLRADQPMAWNDDRQGVESGGPTHRPRRPGLSESLGELAVRDRLAVGYFRQRLPYSSVMDRTARVQHEVERAAT